MGPACIVGGRLMHEEHEEMGAACVHTSIPAYQDTSIPRCSLMVQYPSYPTVHLLPEAALVVTAGVQADAHVRSSARARHGLGSLCWEHIKGLARIPCRQCGTVGLGKLCLEQSEGQGTEERMGTSAAFDCPT